MMGSTAWRIPRTLLDEELVDIFELTAAPHVSPVPVLVLEVESSASIPWTDLDLGPYTLNPAEPVPGTTGKAIAVVLDVEIDPGGSVATALTWP